VEQPALPQPSPGPGPGPDPSPVPDSTADSTAGPGSDPGSAPCPEPRQGRRPFPAHSKLWAVAAVGVCLGVGLIVKGLDVPAPPPQPSAAQALPGDDGLPSPKASATPAGPAAMLPATPTRVRIPVIDVNAPLTAIALGSDGHLVPPPEQNRNLAGWYQDGTSPGAVGTAVIAGHVDNYSGPAVFYNLGSLKKGMTVDVDRADRTTAVFTVDAVEAFADNNFPDDKVYGAASRPELRLITCGDGFSKSRQQYLGNVVVFAHLTSAVHH